MEVQFHNNGSFTFKHAFDETTEFELNILDTFTLVICSDGSLFANTFAWESDEEDARAAEQKRDTTVREFLCDNYIDDLVGIYSKLFTIMDEADQYSYSDINDVRDMENIPDNARTYILEQIDKETVV